MDRLITHLEMKMPRLKSTIGRFSIVLITHPHQDHCSQEDVAKVVPDKTVFVAPKEGAEKLRGNFANEVIISSPGMKVVG